MRAPTRACQSSGSAGSELDISCIIRGARWHSIRTLPLPLLKESMLKRPLQGSEKSDVNNKAWSKNRTGEAAEQNAETTQVTSPLLAAAQTARTCGCRYDLLRNCVSESNQCISQRCFSISCLLVNDAFRYYVTWIM